jgi:hypothetical protein
MWYDELENLCKGADDCGIDYRVIIVHADGDSDTHRIDFTKNVYVNSTYLNIHNIIYNKCTDFNDLLNILNMVFENDSVNNVGNIKSAKIKFTQSTNISEKSLDFYRNIKTKLVKVKFNDNINRLLYWC